MVAGSPISRTSSTPSATSYKTGADQDPDSPWRDLAQVEAATLDWVFWFNTERLHESIDDLTPDRG